MEIVDGNATHLHFEARLCRMWNCYDMFDKLKSWELLEMVYKLSFTDS